MAHMIAEASGGELFSIRTAEPYPDSYEGTIDVGKVEKNNDARFSDAVDEIRDMEPDAIILDGLHIGGSSVSDAESRVNEWVAELGLSEE